MKKQINHDKHPDESKHRTHRLRKLPDDGDPRAPNNLLTPEQKKNSWTPVGQATDKKLRPQPTKMNSFKSGPSKHVLYSYFKSRSTSNNPNHYIQPVISTPCILKLMLWFTPGNVDDFVRKMTISRRF